MKKIWKVKEKVSNEVLTRFPEVHPVLVQLLHNRGIETQKDFDSFCNPDYGDDLHDPFLFKQMQCVVDRIWKALSSSEIIMIHGDYDADGICGTAILISAMKELCVRTGFDAFETNRVRTYLPHRDGDGYGMSASSVRQFARDGVNLVITVDCGIANIEEIKQCYEHGMEVIVIDHHQLADTIPENALIIHPLVPNETYPFKKLAAVGVVFKVATAMYIDARKRGIDIPEGFEKWLLDLVAIATITDMVPLVGENRVLETYGLVVLNKTKRQGLLALANGASLKLGRLNTVDIGFRIGPRINAAGRISSAEIALKLLLEENDERAIRLASRLNSINTERQKMSDTATKKAITSVGDVSGESFIAVVDTEIHIGVAGLVAGKLVAQTGLPSVVITKVRDRFVGSGRAPKGYHLVEAMDACREFMIGGGGHPEACGFSLSFDNIQPWIDAMKSFSTTRKEKVLSDEELSIDAVVPLSEIGWETVDIVGKMEPYGIANPTPRFLSKNVVVLTIERVGKTGSHLRLTVASDDNNMRQCIGFGMGEKADELSMGDIIDVVYEVGVSEWNGSREIQLQLIDFKKCV